MTHENNVEGLVSKADAAFFSSDFETVVYYSKLLIEKNDPVGFFYYAIVLEKGWVNGEIDLDRAYEYYRKLAVDWQAEGGYVGCVRIILARKEYDQKERAYEYCQLCMTKDSTRIAYVLLGRIHEELCDPPDYKMAKKMYIKAACHGSSWATKKYAWVLGKSGNRIGAALAHVFSVVSRPFYVLIVGKISMRVD